MLVNRDLDGVGAHSRQVEKLECKSLRYWIGKHLSQVAANLDRGMLASPLSDGQSERTMPLSERDRKILDLEGSWWTKVNPKGSQIRELGLSRSQYYAALRKLAVSSDALEHAPLVVRRLRRQQSERRRDRFEGHAVQPHRPRR